MAFIWLAALVLVLCAAGTAAWAGLRAAPYLPTRRQDVTRMLGLADLKPDELVYDLGAGDGRFLIAAAKLQARAVGFEISLLPYLAGRWRLALAGVGRQAQIRWQDFFHVNLNQANVIVCFLTPGAMAKLSPKFKTELRPGTRIVSYAFSLPGWTPVRKDKPAPHDMTVWLYRA